MDWYDVESRIRQICNEIIGPIAEITTESRAELNSEQIKLKNVKLNIEKLNEAIFYKDGEKNAFTEMIDQITDLKASKIRHEKQTKAAMNAFSRQIAAM